MIRRRDLRSILSESKSVDSVIKILPELVSHLTEKTAEAESGPQVHPLAGSVAFGDTGYQHMRARLPALLYHLA